MPVAVSPDVTQSLCSVTRSFMNWSSLCEVNNYRSRVEIPFIGVVSIVSHFEDICGL